MIQPRVIETPVATGRLVMAGFGAIALAEAHARLVAAGFALELQGTDLHGSPFYRSPAASGDDVVLRENGTPDYPLEPEHPEYPVLVHVNAAASWEPLLARLAAVEGLALLTDEVF